MRGKVQLTPSLSLQLVTDMRASQPEASLLKLDVWADELWQSRSTKPVELHHLNSFSEQEVALKCTRPGPHGSVFLLYKHLSC